MTPTSQLRLLNTDPDLLLNYNHWLRTEEFTKNDETLRISFSQDPIQKQLVLNSADQAENLLPSDLIKL